MSKFIKDSTYNALVAARDNWNTVAAHVANSGDGGEGLTAETVTPQMVIDALEAESDTAQNAELQAALDRIQVLETENTSLTEQVANLQGSAGEGTAVITSTGEQGGQGDDLASFMEANKGNHAILVERMKKEGLI
ncbi:MAG: hypothetical protein BGN96_13720 [Bacteroidales bacterium 45-6]|nr:MAG: hypothetical protein BGN96_13720 [Bacteroidales bacterium 45-6]